MDISDTQSVICDHQEKTKEVKLLISRETEPCACSWPLSPKVSTTYSRGRVNLCKSPVCSDRHSTDLHDLPGMQVQRLYCHCKLQPHVWRYWPLGLGQTNHPIQTCSAVTAKTVNVVVSLLEGNKKENSVSQKSWISWIYLPELDGQVGLTGLGTKLHCIFLESIFKWKRLGWETSLGSTMINTAECYICICFISPRRSRYFRVQHTW